MAVDTRPPAIALMGPTASGKSALALDWAAHLGGEIVSVDSALVYRGLDIGSAKPDAAERAAVPHHLLDVRDPWQAYPYRQTVGFGATYNRTLSPAEREAAAGRGAHKPQ